MYLSNYIVYLVYIHTQEPLAADIYLNNMIN